MRAIRLAGPATRRITIASSIDWRASSEPTTTLGCPRVARNQASKVALDLTGAVLQSLAPMRHPSCLTPLVEQGIIQEVVRPLMSGKEAQIYLVVSGDELRVAKVYKEAQDRTFKHRAEYTEGRAVRNTRTQRAINKHSRFGRVQDEATWRSAEVDII